jgi:hypothetical protein
VTLSSITDYIELASIEAEYVLADLMHELTNLSDVIDCQEETSAAVERLNAAYGEFAGVLNFVLHARHMAETKRSAARTAA